MFSFHGDRRSKSGWIGCASRAARGIGPVTVRDLIAYCGTAAKALEALPGSRAARRCPAGAALLQARGRAGDRGARRSCGARLIARPDPDYPRRSPLWRTRRRSSPSKAAPTCWSLQQDRPGRRPQRLGQWPADRRPTWRPAWPGPARSWSAAWRGASTPPPISARSMPGRESGGTIAVVAGGIDVLYPPENGALFARLGAEGLVVAESALGPSQSPGTSRGATGSSPACPGRWWWSRPPSRPAP